jgi:hypothetical protein
MLGTRVRPEVKEHYVRLAAEYGLSQSDLLAALLRIGERHIDELGEITQQEELPLTQAS